jgi:hypothetical protein
VESILGPLCTSATTGLWYLPQVIVMMENLVEWRLAGETEVLGENLAQRYFVHHKSHLPNPGSNPGRRDGKPVTNRLSYGAALTFLHSNASDRVLIPGPNTIAVSQALPTHRKMLAHDARVTSADAAMMTLRHGSVGPGHNLRSDSNGPVCGSEICLRSKLVMRVNKHWMCVCPRKHERFWKYVCL